MIGPAPFRGTIWRIVWADREDDLPGGVASREAFKPAT